MTATSVNRRQPGGRRCFAYATMACQRVPLSVLCRRQQDVKSIRRSALAGGRRSISSRPKSRRQVIRPCASHSKTCYRCVARRSSHRPVRWVYSIELSHGWRRRLDLRRQRLRQLQPHNSRSHRVTSRHAAAPPVPCVGAAALVAVVMKTNQTEANSQTLVRICALGCWRRSPRVLSQQWHSPLRTMQSSATN